MVPVTPTWKVMSVQLAPVKLPVLPSAARRLPLPVSFVSSPRSPQRLPGAGRRPPAGRLAVGRRPGRGARRGVGARCGWASASLLGEDGPPASAARWSGGRACKDDRRTNRACTDARSIPVPRLSMAPATYSTRCLRSEHTRLDALCYSVYAPRYCRLGGGRPAGERASGWLVGRGTRCSISSTSTRCSRPSNGRSVRRCASSSTRRYCHISGGGGIATSSRCK